MSAYNIVNALENLDLKTFLAKAGMYNGPSKSSRFYVRITPPAINVGTASLWQDLPYLCEQVELPGRGSMSMDIRYYGPNFKMPYQTTYEDLNMTFIVRDRFLERELFDTWMERINPTTTYDFEYRDKYATTIEVFQLSDIAGGPNKPIPQYKFKFHKAWPILVNPQPVTWADDNFHRLVVSFTYQKWTLDQFEKSSGSFDLATGESPNLQLIAPADSTPTTALA